MIHDLVIVGGGPSGLALSIHAARQGLSTVVLERQRYPVDKACGEGLMPSGVDLLDGLGVRERLSSADCSPFVGIRYVQEDGTRAEGSFAPGRPGLGVRRTALSLAMAARARELGADLREGVSLRSWSRAPDAVAVECEAGRIQARLLVAADGVNSPLRRESGLETRTRLPPRYGLRRHYAIAPWTDRVEVHFGSDVEAYVTPVGDRRVGVAFLWTRAEGAEQVSFEALLSRFPELQRHLAGATYDSTARGAGPLARGVRSRVADRFALLGDSAGYVDAITGEGLTLGFRAAAALAQVLPDALNRGASAESLQPYARACAEHFAPYSRMTRSLLWLARHPKLRRNAVRLMARSPRLFDGILQRVG